MESRSGSYPKAQTSRAVPSATRVPKPLAVTSNATRYRVRAGDTLYAIAWRNDKDFRDLARWNGIRKPYTIYQGQWLRLKPPKRRLPPAPASKTQTSPEASRNKPVAKPQKVAPKAASNPPKKVVAQKAGPLKWKWPAKGGVQSTYRSGDRLRKGIKLAGNPGDPVRAAESGKVVYSGSGLIGYGRLIIVKHNDKYLSAYGHNRKLLAKQGQHVTKGQQIAEMGMSNEGKPLLHFEIRRNGKPVNPLALLPRR